MGSKNIFPLTQWITIYCIIIYHNGFADEELLTLKPVENEEELDFIELRRKIPNTCAWLTVDDTHIDYPVVQGKDDMEYISKNVYGDYPPGKTYF